MRIDERCSEFDSTIIERKSWEDGDDEYLTERFACGCVHDKGDENTPGFRAHWDYYLCNKCKKLTKEN